MAKRSIATLSLTFGLVSIPVKVYAATESSSAISFKLMASNGARLRQQYVADALPVPAVAEPAPPQPPVELPTPRPRGKDAVAAASAVVSSIGDASRSRTSVPLPDAEPVDEPIMPAPAAGAVIERATMTKGYEYERGKFVLFTPAELEALAQQSRQTIDIVSFIPAAAIDPIYFDKAYFLAPDKRGAKPYSLLLRALQDTGRCALAKWAWRAKEYVVQVRAVDGGLVLQQLLYADEVRSIEDLDIALTPVADAELELAKMLIAQVSADSYDPTQFVDEEKQRILAAVEEKIAGRKVITHGAEGAAPAGAEVIDLMEALRASLAAKPSAAAAPAAAAPSELKLVTGPRKPVRRAPKTETSTAPAKRSGS